MFSQSALYEIGSVLTVFAVKRHSTEFLAALDAAGAELETITAKVDTVTVAEDDDVIDEPRAERVHRQTKDFVLEQLSRVITPREFEEFTAALLRAMATKRASPKYSGDGGVDVIAHRDPLGIEPPLIKVQCNNAPQPSGPGSRSAHRHARHRRTRLFVSLGSYSRDALSTERQRRGLRLITGEELVELVIANYEKLDPVWRARIPLRQVYVVDDTADF